MSKSSQHRTDSVFADVDISVDLLRRRHPRRYSRWVLAGILICILGYSASSLVAWSERGLRSVVAGVDFWALGPVLASLLLWKVGQVKVAGSLTLLLVFLELHLAVATGSTNSWAVNGLMFPVLNLVAALWLGPRAAIVLGLGLLVSVPGAIHISGLVGSSQGLGEPHVTMYLVVLSVALIATNTLVFVYLKSLGDILRRSEVDEARIRDLLNATPDVILAVSADGRIESANRAVNELLGIAAHRLEGTKIVELNLECEGADWREIVPVLAERQNVLLVRVPATNKELELLVRPVSIAAADPGLLLLLRDCTARRAAERETRDLQTQLQHAQKMEAVGQLAGGVAHDFNNLLTAVGGYGSLLATSSDPDAREFSTEIMAAQERGAALVRQLLAFARRDLAQERPFDLSAELVRMLTLIQRMVGERITVELVAPEACPILADPGRIEQVVLNLVANARDVMPDGGRLSLRCHGQSETVTLEIEDTGAGMAEEVQSRIFEPFFTTKAAGKGTGLGLSMVHGIITEAGGSIVVDSTVGQGTRFVIKLVRTHLPLQQPAAKRVGRNHQHGKGQRILLAEDNDGVRNYLRRLLDYAGYEVEVARSGDEGLELIRAFDEPPALLLTDVVMPGLTGVQLVPRAREKFPGLPCLLMSGYLGGEATEASWDITPDLIMKPFTDEDLLGRIHEKVAPD